MTVSTSTSNHHNTSSSSVNSNKDNYTQTITTTNSTSDDDVNSDNVNDSYNINDSYNVTNVYESHMQGLYDIFITAFARIEEIYGPQDGDEVDTYYAPILSVWEDNVNLSLQFVVPKQAEDYDVDVYAVNNSNGDIFDLDGEGMFFASEGHQANFFDISGDDIQSGMLWGQGGVYDFLDITGIDGTFTIHAELVGVESGDILHDTGILVTL